MNAALNLRVPYAMESRTTEKCMTSILFGIQEFETQNRECGFIFFVFNLHVYEILEEV